MGETREKVIPLTRESLINDEYTKQLNPIKLLQLDPIYGGEKSADAIPATNRKRLIKMATHNPQRDQFIVNFYSHCQLSFVGCTFFGHFFAITLPILSATWMRIRVFGLALLGVVVYPLYRFDTSDRKMMVHVYPSNRQYFQYAIQQLREKYSFTRLWNFITRKVNIVPVPNFATINKGKAEESTWKSWFNLRIRNKQERAFQEHKNPHIILKKPIENFDLKDIFVYYRRKLLDRYAKHPMKLSADDLRVKYQFSNNTITFRDRLGILSEYLMPRRYLVRFMRTKYLGRHRRHSQKLFLRIFPLSFVITSMGLWIIPRPFRDATPETLGYVYTITGFLIWKMLTRFWPITREQEYRNKVKEKITLTRKLARGTFWLFSFLIVSNFISRIIIVFEGSSKEEHKFRETKSALPELDRAIFRDDGVITFEPLFNAFREAYTAYKISKKDFRDRISLDSDLEATFDPKNLFEYESIEPSESENLLLHLNHKGEYVLEEVNSKNIYNIEMAKMLFMGNKEEFVEFDREARETVEKLIRDLEEITS